MRSRLPALVALVVVLAGCGPAGQTVDTRMTLLLDRRPSAVDAGIYLALERGYDSDSGVRLELRTARGRAAARVAAARADAAIVDARALHGLVAVLAITQRPVDGHLDVLAVSRTTIEDRRADVKALVGAIQRGYVETQVDPESAVSAVLDREDGLDRTRLLARLGDIAPAFTEGVAAFGDPAVVRRYAPGAAVDGSLGGPVGRD